MKTLKLSGLASATLLVAQLAPAPFLAAAHAEAVSAEQQEEANKDLVIAFYNKALNEKDFDAASRYLGERYIQHNPTAADGAEGLKAFVEFLRREFPQSHNEIKHAYADGDHVILHVHSVRVPGTLGRAIVDIFRLENGKVVEHWDVIQDVPAPEQTQNDNGMF